MNLEIKYHKPQKTLFNELKKDNIINVQNIQNYLPIYQLLFQLNDTNYNSINFENKFYINKFNKKLDNNNYNVTLNNNKDIDIFIKYSAIIDPSKYLIGKYKDIESFNLPKLNIKENNDLVINKKINNPYNSSYVDGCFSYLSNHLLNNYNFQNGIGFYGFYLGNKIDYRYNLEDDIMYVHNSEFFNNNLNKLFTLDEEYRELFNNQSRSNNEKLTISDDNIELNLVKKLDSNDISDKLQTENVDTFKLIEELNINKKKKTNSFNSSNCSSNVSLTSDENNSDSDDENDLSDDKINLNIEKISTISNPITNNETIKSCNSSLSSISHSSSDGSNCSDSSDMNIFINIPNFPTNLICLEKCENTLDHYIIHSDIDKKEWYSLLFQIIFTLLTYQKLFNFTHNDLHTNNVMYQSTEKQFLYYHYNNNYYKVPTFGKIWKIIDFGRAIYNVKDNVIYSDSFENGEDAYSQYNFDKFRNKNKPEIKPNYSFDLCRLGCSLFEYFFSETQELNVEKMDDLEKLVNEWCTDDCGRNILFKSNGEERYPDFKLYKMIARTVTNHTPENMLKKDIFKQFTVSKNKINNKKAIFSISHILATN